LEFDLDDDNFFGRIEGYGICLVPTNGFPIRIPAYGANNGYYTTNLALILSDGDKVKFAYLKQPNPIGDTVIATPDELPKQFNLDKYIDREMQFEKSFVEPLRSITEVIDWEVEHRSTLEEFFG
jgi:hypothetical protein